MAVVSLRTKELAGYTCPPTSKRILIRDSLCKGLTLEVRASGGKTWYLIYTCQRGRRRFHRLGDQLDLSLKQARTLAERCRTRIAMGGDPAAERKALRQIPTLRTFVVEHYLPFVQTYKRSWHSDRSALERLILPALGDLPLDGVQRHHVFAMQKQWIRLGRAPATINKYLVLLRYVFNLAIRWEIGGIQRNPTTGVAMLKVDNQRQRFLTVEEAKHLLKVLRSSENRQLEAIITFLLLTGARKREVLDARWSDINWEQRIWTIPKTKAGKVRYVPLSDAALYLLILQQRQHPGIYLFPSPRTGLPFRTIYDGWNNARREAGLEDVRIHDLRHSFASFLINGGRSLYEVQQLLGHSTTTMTQRYAHLARETLLQAANTVPMAIASDLYGATASSK